MAWEFPQSSRIKNSSIIYYNDSINSRQCICYLCTVTDMTKETGGEGCIEWYQNRAGLKGLCSAKVACTMSQPMGTLTHPPAMPLPNGCLWEPPHRTLNHVSHVSWEEWHYSRRWLCLSSGHPSSGSSPNSHFVRATIFPAHFQGS